MRLDDLAARLKLEELIRRAAFAPKGSKRKRQAELEAFNRRLLKQDVRAAGRRKGR